MFIDIDPIYKLVSKVRNLGSEDGKFARPELAEFSNNIRVGAPARISHYYTLYRITTLTISPPNFGAVSQDRQQ
jgi:hypothetical protein